MKQDAPKKGKDYTAKCFTLTLTVIVMLLAVMFVPPFKICGVTFKRANILSDIIQFNDRKFTLGEQVLDTSFYEDAPEGLLAMLDRRAAGVGTAAEAGNGTRPEKKYYLKPVITDESLTQIEDYSEGGQMMAKFYHDLAMESKDRTVRIAVFGDSFIEADIITVDMREQLQDHYGGRGPGFVPLSSPLAKYRSSVRHTFNGWETYNIVNKKSVPEEYKGKFAMPGMISIPYEGATVRYEGTEFRRHLGEYSTATIIFRNRNKTNISLSVNGGEASSYLPEASDSLAFVTVDGDIRRFDMKLSNTQGFIGYGAVLEDSAGVSVHNYSVRSNSGTALIGTDAALNRQLDRIMRYDLIVIQYGLNAMSPDVLNYDSYRKQLVRIIEFVKLCFPNSAVVVMSVGDRSTLKDGRRVTMPAALAMLKTQRAAAQETGVGFWNTFNAMGGENSMVRFVERGWAAKDYTHIGFAGGKYIATQFVDFLKAATQNVAEIYGSGLFDDSMPITGNPGIHAYDNDGELDEIMRRNYTERREHVSEEAEQVEVDRDENLEESYEVYDGRDLEVPEPASNEGRQEREGRGNDTDSLTIAASTPEQQVPDEQADNKTDTLAGD